MKNPRKSLKILLTNGHKGSFPQPQHFFAAAQENEDFGALWKGPSMPEK